MDNASGVVTSLQICAAHGLPMQVADPAVFTADLGLKGCRHARAGSRRQVLLIEVETLNELALEPGQVRENITTRAIDLSPLPVDTRLIIGDEVELWITGPCEPCALLDEIRPGLQAELQGRRGVLAWVKRGGQVRVGDHIRALPAGQAADEQEDS